MAHKVVNQHKNTAWAIPSQFRLYLHMYIFYYCTALIFSFTPHWTDILGPQKKKQTEYVNQKKSHGENDSSFHVNDGFDILISISEMK